jgi:hypothetical protein
MSECVVYYALSEAGRKISLLAGGNGLALQGLWVPITADPRLIEACVVDVDGRASLCVGCQLNSSGTLYYGHHEFEAPQTLEQLLSWHATEQLSVVAERERDAAAARAVGEKMVAWVMAQRAEDLLEIVYSGLTDNRCWAMVRRAPGDIDIQWSLPQLGVKRAEVEAVRDGRNDALEAGRAADRARAEAEARAQEQVVVAERAVYAADRSEFVRTQGSARLQLAAALGMLEESDAVYRGERLAAERPGWEWGSDYSNRQDCLNPSLEQLQALAEARASYGEVDLLFIRVGNGDGDVVWRGKVLHATYLGGFIIRRV